MASPIFKYNINNYKDFYCTELQHYSKLCPKKFVKDIILDITPNYSNQRIDIYKGSVIALKLTFQQLHKDCAETRKCGSDDLVRGVCTNANGIDTFEDKKMWSRAYDRKWRISVNAISKDGRRCEIESFYLAYPTIFRFSAIDKPLENSICEYMANEIITTQMSDFKSELTSFLNHALKRFEEF